MRGRRGIGLLTPPVGPTMVVGCAIGRVSMEAVSRSILIFYVPMLIMILRRPNEGTLPRPIEVAIGRVLRFGRSA